MSRIWDDYVTRRFKAHSNLLKILGYQSIELDDPTYYPKTIQEFRMAWGERINIGDRMGYFERDSIPISANLTDGHRIMIMFVAVKEDKLKIPKVTIQSYLSAFLQAMTTLNSDQAFAQTELIRDIECILVSAVPLDGTAKNELVRFNSILQFPVRHFTIEELQYDPTLHATGPKKARVLTQAEVDEYIARQRGLLLNGKNRIVPNFEERLGEKASEAEKIESNT